jgi:hypothetical protein
MEDRARLRAVGWSDDAIDEIGVVAAANVFWNRASTIPTLCGRVPPVVKQRAPLKDLGNFLSQVDNTSA